MLLREHLRFAKFSSTILVGAHLGGAKLDNVDLRDSELGLEKEFPAHFDESILKAKLTAWQRENIKARLESQRLSKEKEEETEKRP